MDTNIETPDTSTTDLVILEPVSNQPEPFGMGAEVTKTLAISAATSAVLFGGYAVATTLLPKLRTWIANRKKDAPEVVEKVKDSVKDLKDQITEND